MEDRGQPFSIISYNELWNEINPGFGSFPNAGIAIKGEWARNNPELSETLLEELKDAINWVNEHRSESARLSFDMMRQPVDRIEKFLDRVNFEYVDGDKLKGKVKQYFEILNEQGITDLKLDDEFMKTFEL
jgi:ABC-type nitrate/sulfonate/bicarbonate transport system substrate-binding protein